jgi:hypothetical protein
VKDVNKPTDSKANLRPVTVSDVSPNFFEKTTLKHVRIQCKTNDKQFGFKKKSCAHAIFVLKQIIKYARMINKRVYMCALDASKAFDKVIRLVLWWKLAMKGICVMLLKALMTYYKLSKIKVQIKNCFSDWIKTTVINKQGGSISPEFYDQHGEEMTYLIEALMEGIMFGCVKVDIIQYADDVTLEAETAAGLQKQIDVCS